MIKIKRLQNVYFVSPRPAETARFYENVLGLPRKFADGERWIQLSAGGSNVALACAEEGVPDQAGAVPVFEVEEADDIHECVTANGGRITGERDMGTHGKVLTVQDPVGNTIQLICRIGG
jgi:predicted enzyme related to lactoylglutathione lyase